MDARRIIVGAVGGDRQADAARAFGAAVARAGCILLTGGGDRDDDEVKNASVQGALAQASAQPVTARFIGILASEASRWEARPPAGLLLHTGLKHYVRNVINGLTPDVVVVFGGSRGTLAEAAFAATAGKPTLFYAGALARLRRNCTEYFGQADSPDVERFLGGPPRHWPQLQGHAWTSDALRSTLNALLDEATDGPGGDAELVEQSVALVRAKGPPAQSGFPGLPGDDASKARFESEIERISKAEAQ
jgi:hypothetical protein